MSKNRLLQIINRLELSPKDKKDLVNIINSNTNNNKNSITEELKDAGMEYYEIIINMPDGLKENDYNTYESLGEAGQILKEQFKKANKSLHVTVNYYLTYNNSVCNINDNGEDQYVYSISWIEIDPRTTYVCFINDIMDDKFYFGIRTIMTE